MKLKAEIEVPDNADWRAIEDAKLKAEWHRVYSVHDRMSRTDLTDKCGSCKHFVSRPFAGSKCSGDCLMCHNNTYKYRTTPKCKKYERREDI